MLMSGNRTVSELFAEVKTMLLDNGCETADFDAMCLLEDIGQIGRGAVSVHRDQALPKNRVDAVLNAAKRRANGYPLQYLLGSWDFLNLTLAVGEGVLIPRPETELLCERVAQMIKQRFGSAEIVLYDLCAGSGCVGLGIASLLPNTAMSIHELELSDDAFSYLEKNINAYEPQRARAVKADVLSDMAQFDQSIDVLVSNPPYIPSDDLPFLQTEVQNEPMMALDGDTDGLVFYRAIATHWIPKVKNGGIVAVEIGIGQSADVSALFSDAGLSHIEILSDFSGIDRVIVGIKE